MIFGPNGETISKTGNSYYTKDGYVHKSGSTYFGPNGQTASETGNSLFSSQGIIGITGNSLYTPNGVYSLTGSTLYGPDGQVWSGVESMEDAKVVVLNGLANSKQQSSSAPLIPWDSSDKEPINLSTGATLALIGLIGIGGLLLIIFL